MSAVAFLPIIIHLTEILGYNYLDIYILCTLHII